jgi:hypothetical protein
VQSGAIRLPAGGHDRPGGNSAATMRALPFGRGGIGRRVPHTEAANVAADLLSIDHRLVPWAVIGHRPFNGKFSRVAIDNDQNKGAARQIDVPPSPSYTSPVYTKIPLIGVESRNQDGVNS